MSKNPNILYNNFEQFLLTPSLYVVSVFSIKQMHLQKPIYVVEY